MLASKILKTVDFTKAQKFRYLENKILTFFQKKKKKKRKKIALITHQGLLYGKK